MIILKTIKGAMLQDTVAGIVYTPRSPHLTEMNSFVESFVNSQTTGSQGGPSMKRPKQLLVLVNSDECANLDDGVGEKDLTDAWIKYIDGLRKDVGGGKAGNKAVDSLTDEQWASWCKDWVKANSGSKKKAKVADPADDDAAAAAAKAEAEAQANGNKRGGNRG